MTFIVRYTVVGIVSALILYHESQKVNYVVNEKNV